MRLYFAFGARLGRPSWIFGRPGGPGLDFGGQNALIFGRFRCSCAFRANFVRGQQKTVKTGTRGTSERMRDGAKTAKIRSASAFDSARCTKRARATLRGCPGASRDRPGEAFGWLPVVLGSPPASQGRSRGGLLVSRARPERVTARPRYSFEHPKPPKNEFSSIFHRFSSIFGRFSVDFRSIFR